MHSARRRDAPGAQGGLGPVGGLQLVQDAGDVVLHGLQRKAEGACDVPVAGAVGQQAEHPARPSAALARFGRSPDLVGDDPDARGMYTRVRTGLIPIDAGHRRAAALKHEHEHRRCRVRRR